MGKNQGKKIKTSAVDPVCIGIRPCPIMLAFFLGVYQHSGIIIEYRVHIVE